MLRHTSSRLMLLNESRLKTNSMGTKPHTGPLRLRSPWTRTKESVPIGVYKANDETLLEGTQPFQGLGRVEQLEPLQALRTIVAKRNYLTNTGLTLFQVAAHLPHDGRGQIFWRDGWRDGTNDKYVTLSRISFERDISEGGEAWGYVTFQGESTTRPVKLDFSNIGGWHCDFAKERAVAPGRIVDPPASIGTDVPVDPKVYKLKSYPFYDAPAPEEWELRRFKESGVIPDPPVDEDADAPAADGGGEDDGSTHVSAK